MEKIECMNCKENPCHDCQKAMCEDCNFAPFRRNGTYPCGQYKCWLDLYNEEEKDYA